MIESETSCQEATSVAVLFAPEIVPIIDVFRALDAFEEQYELDALDRLESRLARTVSREIAKGIVSDALLLTFGLRRERPSPLVYRELRSRRATLDEYRLMALVAAVYRGDGALAAEAAASLDIVNTKFVVFLAGDLARWLELAGVEPEVPDRRLFNPSAANLPVEAQPGRPDRCA
jgi:hypothetical protein